MSIEIIQCNALEWLEKESAKGPRFDCIITDPPYDSLMKWQGVGTTARMGFGAGKDAAESEKFYPTIDREEMWDVICALDGLAKDNSHTYIMADGEYMPVILAWVRESGELGWKYSKPLVWDKVNAGMGYHWRGTHEYIVMLEKGKRRLNDLGKQDVLRHKRVTGGYPTEKPMGLIEDLLLNSTKEGDWVFDPFMGGGYHGGRLPETQPQLCDVGYFFARHCVCAATFGTTHRRNFNFMKTTTLNSDIHEEAGREGSQDETANGLGWLVFHAVAVWSALAFWLRFKRVCAWHQPRMIRMGGNPLARKVTHGMCPECFQRVNAELLATDAHGCPRILTGVN